MPRKIKDDVYPNSPLAEVIFELRFSGDPAVECRRDIFFNLVRKDYPQVLVPHAKEGKALALEPYRFEREDKSAGILLALNRFSYYCRKYQGFSLFKKEFLLLLRSFREAYPSIDTLSRTGFRYVNIIPFARESGTVPLSKFLNLALSMPAMVPQSFENISVGFITKTNDGSVTARVETMKSSDQTGEAILLDLDYAKNTSLSINHVRKYMEESHSFARQLFEQIITDEYRAFLRGDAV